MNIKSKFQVEYRSCKILQLHVKFISLAQIISARFINCSTKTQTETEKENFLFTLNGQYSGLRLCF